MKLSCPFESVSAHTCLVLGANQASATGSSPAPSQKQPALGLQSMFQLVPLVLQDRAVSQSAEKWDHFTKFSPVFLIAHINTASH